MFGHEYLNIAWKERVERWGLFNYHFLSRNLAASLVLLPKIFVTYPFVQYSRHGMSHLPDLAERWPGCSAGASPARSRRALWITILAAALPSLLYQNSGYQQFGYRFLQRLPAST